MLSFLQYLLEAATKPSAKSSQDSMGKLHELLVARELNGGSHPEHHRDEKGLSPEQAHDAHAAALFGRNFTKHAGYQRMLADARAAANGIRKHLKEKHGISKLGRVAWTSQKSDHKKETGVDDPNSKADLIVTSGHPEHRGKKVGVSLKVGKTKTPNYSNPGLSTFEGWSGTKLKKHVDEHTSTLSKYGNPSHEEYKASRDSSTPKRRKMADEIKASSDRMNAKVAATMRAGMAKKSHKELYDIVKGSTSPRTHLPEIVSHTVHNADGSSSHDVHPHEEHINKYLSNFHSLHVKPNGTGNSVTIHGIHKKTGKVMKVWQSTVYAGGRPANRSPRGATTLPSESHKDVVGVH